MGFRQNIVFVSLTWVIAFLLCVSPQKTAAQSKPQYDGVKTIVIDAGHGGGDPGACYGKVYEKTITLKVALLLGDMIKKNLPDVKVVYTRDKDVAVDLSKRGEIANNANADLFVSIHVNSVNGKAPSGTETYVMGMDHEQRNLNVAMKENDVVLLEKDYSTKYAGFTPGSAESYIIFSLMQYVNLDQSIVFADMIEKQYKKNTAMPSRGTKRAPLLVLWRTTMPGVLTEVGFLPNENDRKLMTSEAGQRKIATSLFNSISEYKAKVEGRSKPLQLEMSDAEIVGPKGSDVAPADKSVEAVKNNNGVVYRVQICSSPKKIPAGTGMLKSFRGEKITERKVGVTYKYYVGEFARYKDAAEKQAEVRKTVIDAFMVAFDGEDQISVKDARGRE